jgi:hypothetical protein
VSPTGGAPPNSWLLEPGISKVHGNYYLSPPPDSGNGAGAAAGGGMAAVRRQQQHLQYGQQQQLPYGQQQQHLQYGQQQQQQLPHGQLPYGQQQQPPYGYQYGGNGGSSTKEDDGIVSAEEDITLDILEPVVERRVKRRTVKKRNKMKTASGGSASPDKRKGGPSVASSAKADAADLRYEAQRAGLEGELDAWLARAKPTADNLRRAKFAYVKKHARQAQGARLPLAPRGFYAPMK